MSEIERPFSGVMADAVAGAAIGFVFGGPPGGVTGALTPVASRLVSLAQRELQAGHGRAGAMWLIAGEGADASLELLVTQAESDATRSHLAFTAAEAAQDSLYPARIVALGRVLADGLMADEDAKVDEAQLVVDAIAQIDRSHLRVLVQFVNIEGHLPDVTFVRRTLAWDDLLSLTKGYERVVPRLLAQVEREGLVQQESVAMLADDSGRPPDNLDRGGHFWRITDFGYDVLHCLFAAGASNEL